MASTGSSKWEASIRQLETFSFGIRNNPLRVLSTFGVNILVMTRSMYSGDDGMLWPNALKRRIGCFDAGFPRYESRANVDSAIILQGSARGGRLLRHLLLLGPRMLLGTDDSAMTGPGFQRRIGARGMKEHTERGEVHRIKYIESCRSRAHKRLHSTPSTRAHEAEPDLPLSVPVA